MTALGIWLLISATAAMPLAWFIGSIALEYSLMSALAPHRGRFHIIIGGRIREINTAQCPLELLTESLSGSDRTLYHIDGPLLLKEVGLDRHSRVLIAAAADGRSRISSQYRWLDVIDNWRIGRLRNHLLTLCRDDS
jgi:hypothetical protein